MVYGSTQVQLRLSPQLLQIRWVYYLLFQQYVYSCDVLLDSDSYPDIFHCHVPLS